MSITEKKRRRKHCRQGTKANEKFRNNKNNDDVNTQGYGFFFQPILYKYRYNRLSYPQGP